MFLDSVMSNGSRLTRSSISTEGEHDASAAVLAAAAAAAAAAAPAVAASAAGDGDDDGFSADEDDEDEDKDEEDDEDEDEEEEEVEEDEGDKTAPRVRCILSDTPAQKIIGMAIVKKMQVIALPIFDVAHDNGASRPTCPPAR
jgi:hypothetical protein